MWWLLLKEHAIECHKKKCTHYRVVNGKDVCSNESKMCYARMVAPPSLADAEAERLRNVIKAGLAWLEAKDNREGCLSCETQDLDSALGSAECALEEALRKYKEVQK